MENKNSTEISLLLEAAERMDKKNPPPEDQNEFQTRLTSLRQSPLLAEYELDENDLRIITILFNNYLNGLQGLKIKQLLKTFGINKMEVVSFIKRLKKLEKKGLLENEEDDFKEAFHPANLFRSPWELSREFIEQILLLEEESVVEIKPYEDHEEYLNDQFKRVGGIERPRFMPKFRGGKLRFSSRSRRRPETTIKQLEEEIAKRLKKTGSSFPLEELKKKHRLTREEELILIALLQAEKNEEAPIDLEELIDLVNESDGENESVNRRYFDKNGKLIKQKLVVIEEESHPVAGFKTKTAKLDEKVLRSLLRRKRKSADQMLMKDRFFELVKPEISLQQVILHPKTMDQVRAVIELNSGQVSLLLNEWGFKLNPKIQTRSKKRQAAIAILLYGHPGTGKTLTASAISAELKRELLTFDCSTILNSYVGVSEKNVKMIFTRYREIASGMKNPPILLLNEADQFLHKRISASKGVDHMYNQMQNIFLEQLEQFDGILIATTNLVDNMDSAFSRRFHYKIEFSRPGLEERVKLWKALIPEKTPLAGDVDLSILAKRFDLSGGQLTLVIRNAAIKAARRGTQLCQQDFITTCEEEMAGNFDEKARGRVGF
ncbi:MAG: ATP-binding protein [Nitrospirae bacterium]|nr:ATP-binding protein [Nitrospirota bacterium]MBI3352792.1 ATP-binding protein [Nitrospirota bacterium]